MRFDVAVIGGGPGGSSAAIRLRQRGFRVLLVEKDLFPREKLCGEFLSPEVHRLAGELGIQSELLNAAPAQLSLIRLHLYGDALLEVPLSASALGLSRAVFDHLLLRHAARLGVEVLTQTTAESIQRDPSGKFLVAFQRNGQSKTALARAVICATGRWSRWSPHVRSKPGHRRGARVAYAFKAHYESSVVAANILDLHFFPGGYCGVSQVEGGHANVCCLVERGLLKESTAAGGNPSRILLRQPSLGSQLLGGKRVSEFLFTGPLFFGGARPVQDSMLMVGDCAAFVDPFCGDGISIAMHSGLLAAGALDPMLLGNCRLETALSDYARAYERSFGAQFRWSGLLRSLVRSPRGTRWAVRLVGSSIRLRQELFTRTRPNIAATVGPGWDGSLICRR